MIKFSLRRNLIYPLQLLIFNVVRDTERDLLSIYFNFDFPLIFTPLMLIGEFLAGLLIYLYQKNITAKKISNINKQMNLEKPKWKLNRIDGIIKIVVYGSIGQKNKKTADNASRMGFVVAKGKTKEEAFMRCDASIKKIEICYR